MADLREVVARAIREAPIRATNGSKHVDPDATLTDGEFLRADAAIAAITAWNTRTPAPVPAKSRSLHFVFRAPPGPGDECVFVELEDEAGHSISAGEWRTRPDGRAELVISTGMAPAPVPADVEGLYLIEKRGLYYRPNASGYTGLKSEAGRYSFEDAAVLAGPNGPDGSRDGIEIWREADAPDFAPACDHETRARGTIRAQAARIAELEAERDAAFDLVAHLDRQRAFSARTFGPGHRVGGVADHIRKELAEVEADHAAGADTLPEWIDVVMLALDGAWRSGATSAAIAEALAAKLERNEARTWPDWRTADPDKAIEHVRASGEGAGA